MSAKKLPLASLVLVLTLFGLVGAACSDDKEETGTGGGGEFTCPEGADLEASGSINISGSSTVAPITQQAADCFADAGGTSGITVDNPGTGDGFKLFCEGSTDISDASRKIESDEAAACQAKGIEFVEIKVAIDGLSVMTNSANDGVECLSFPDLYAIVGPESQGFDNWSDAKSIAGELGSTTTFPDAPLVINAPGEESGTYDSFIEIALEPIAKARTTAGKITKDKEKSTRPDYTSNSNDDAIIEGIKGADTSFGWVGFAFADQAGDPVKLLQIANEPGGKCVQPTPATIADGSFPLSRGLYIYVNKAKEASNPAIGSFVDYYLAGLTEIVEEADYIALPSDQASKATSRWEARTVGTES